MNKSLHNLDSVKAGEVKLNEAPIALDKEVFYVTTPIYYPNAAPHIGHAYTTVIADVVNRYHRLFGKKTFFVTGTDEHGQKVQQSAEQRGVNPQEYVDELSGKFAKAWAELSIEPSLFMRTTFDFHKELVRDCLQKLYDRGEIYQGEYSGWYCVSDEIFLTDKDLVDGKSPTGKEVLQVSEKAYFFRMSKYQERLIQYIEEHPGFIGPEQKRSEVLGFLRKELEDLCLSRPKSRVSWGIELPFDSEFVTYVWFDALLNYVSAIDEGKLGNRFREYWDTATHLIGKDILITHAVYWPTMLMALELPLPARVFAHGWWLNSDGRKMSKSEGDVVAPANMKETFGEDAFRFYMTRGVKFKNDLSFDLDKAKDKINLELANNYGNLVSRTLKMVTNSFDGKIPEGGLSDLETRLLVADSLSVAKKVHDLVETLKIEEAVGEVVDFCTRINRYIDSQRPWGLLKEGKLEKAGEVLYASMECLRIVTILLNPVMPKSTVHILNLFGLDESHVVIDNALKWGLLESGASIKEPRPVFKRL